jgi:hypothetical protein
MLCAASGIRRLDLAGHLTVMVARPYFRLAEDDELDIDEEAGPDPPPQPQNAPIRTTAPTSVRPNHILCA